MTRRYRLLVTDVDGTLIGRSLRPSPRVAAALRAARDDGLQVALCTGRAPAACVELLTALDLDGYHIFFDGALVGDSTLQRVVALHALAGDTCAALVATSANAGLNLELYTVGGYYVARSDARTDVHSRVQGLAAQVADLTSLLQTAHVIKAELVVATDEERAAARALARMFRGRLRFAEAQVAGYPELSFINIVAPEVSKASGLAALAGACGCGLDEVVAVGDGPNDLPLLKAAGLGVAMGNAPPAVRVRAAWVTDDVEADGLAVLVERLVAERQCGGRESRRG